MVANNNSLNIQSTLDKHTAALNGSSKRSDHANNEISRISEVIAHLLEHFSKKHNKLNDVLINTFKTIKGSFALGIIYEKEPDKVIVASNGSPLLIGLGKNVNYISSDIQALSSKTKKYPYNN